MSRIQKFFLSEVDSTNIRLQELLDSGEASPFAYLRADKQNSGYGRDGRSWSSPKGNLYVSFALDAPPIKIAPQLGFVMSLAVYDTLCGFLAAPPLRLKWPNDLLYDDAKIAGLLLETHKRYIIIGVGINIINAPKGLHGSATTCLARHMESSPPNAEELCERLANAFLKRYEAWQQNGFNFILQQWQQAAHNRGERLSVHWLGTLQSGTFAGLNRDGALLLQCQEELLQISAADVFLGDGT